MRVGDPPVGGRYSLVEPFGADERFAGGKVQTWRAHDDVVERAVVLRVMTPGGNAAKLFLDRALEMSMIAHPGLGVVYEAVDHGDYAVVVSEWIEGTSLSKTLQEHGPLTPKTARQTLGDLAEAITVAHHAGLPIGGMTAERVVLRDDASVTVTAVPALFADERGDIQQLGRLLFAALTGAEPASDDPDPFKKLDKGVPRELVVLCQRALDDDPSRQLGSAAAFAAVLSPKTKPVSPSGETAGRAGERLGGLDVVPEQAEHDTAPAEFAVAGQRGRAGAADEPRVVGQVPGSDRGRGTAPKTDRIPIGNGANTGAGRDRSPTKNGKGLARNGQTPTTTQAIPIGPPSGAAKATPPPIGEPKPAGQPRSPTRPPSGSDKAATSQAGRTDGSAAAAAAAPAGSTAGANVTSGAAEAAGNGAAEAAGNSTDGATSAAESGGTAVPTTESIPTTAAPSPTQAIPIGPSSAGPIPSGPSSTGPSSAASSSTPTTQEIPNGQARAAPEPAAPTQAISIPTRPSTEDSAAARPNDTGGAFRADVRADWAEPPPDVRNDSPIRTAEDYDPWLDDTGGWGNHEADYDDDDDPYEGGQTRRKVLLYAVPLSALILVIMLAVFVGKQFSAALPDGGPAVLPTSATVAPTVATSESAPSDTAAPVAAALPIASAAVFDPFGDGQPENDGDVGLTYDGDVASAWATLTYQSTPQFGNLKPGVGVIYDLGAEHSISSIELATNLPGTAVEVRVGAAPDAALESYPVVGALDPFTDTGAVQLAEPVRARFVIVWFVRLVEANGGFKGTLSECRILGV